MFYFIKAANDCVSDKCWSKEDIKLSLLRYDLRTTVFELYYVLLAFMQHLALVKWNIQALGLKFTLDLVVLNAVGVCGINHNLFQ